MPMRNIALILVFVSTVAIAQKAPLAEQKSCYEQARKYVADSNAATNPPGLYSFSQAHYDSKVHTCYVLMQSVDPVGNSAIMNIVVDDAYEGKIVAQCVYTIGANDKPTVCQVNGQKADSRANFNYLLWKMIPAFKPVTAEDAK
jgi:hypothetical protein